MTLEIRRLEEFLKTQMIINTLVVLGLSRKVAVINVGLKVHLIHCLRMIMQTTL